MKEIRMDYSDYEPYDKCLKALEECGLPIQALYDIIDNLKDDKESILGAYDKGQNMRGFYFHYYISTRDKTIKGLNNEKETAQEALRVQTDQMDANTAKAYKDGGNDRTKHFVEMSAWEFGQFKKNYVEEN